MPTLPLEHGVAAPVGAGRDTNIQTEDAGDASDEGFIRSLFRGFDFDWEIMSLGNFTDVSDTHSNLYAPGFNNGFESRSAVEKTVTAWLKWNERPIRNVGARTLYAYC